VLESELKALLIARRAGRRIDPAAKPVNRNDRVGVVVVSPVDVEVEPGSPLLDRSADVELNVPLLIGLLGELLRLARIEAIATKVRAYLALPVGVRAGDDFDLRAAGVVVVCRVVVLPDAIDRIWSRLGRRPPWKPFMKNVAPPGPASCESTSASSSGSSGSASISSCDSEKDDVLFDASGAVASFTCTSALKPSMCSVTT
jgi:hypothetical protein